MKCPGCSGKTTTYQTVTQNGSEEELSCVVRMRTCKRCKRRWKTEEVAIGEIIDGVVQLFDHSDEELYGDVEGEPWYMEGAFKRTHNETEEETADAG